jgi:hypothetical protein
MTRLDHLATRHRRLLAHSALLLTELTIVMAHSRALYHRAHVVTDRALPIRGGSTDGLERRSVVPGDRRVDLWHFLERPRGEMFCAACLHMAIKATGRLDLALIAAEGRGARRVYGDCPMCGRPRLLCGLAR